MKKRSYFSFLIHIFSMVMAGVVLAVAIFTTIIDPVEEIESILLWQMLLVSGLCTMTALIHPWSREMSKVEAIVKTLIQYVLINVIVLGSGALFRWYNPSKFYSVLGMVLTIAIIFGTITASSWKRAALDAARMNEKLEEYQKRMEKNSGECHIDGNDLQNSC